MANFPVLKTGAVAQYPATRKVRYATGVVRFVDGTEQRFRDLGAPIRRWVIRLDLLDETEIWQIEDFFNTEQGRLGSFAFTDPWDGVVYADCSLDGDVVDLSASGPARGRSALVVKQNIV